MNNTNAHLVEGCEAWLIVFEKKPRQKRSTYVGTARVVIIGQRDGLTSVRVLRASGITVGTVLHVPHATLYDVRDRAAHNRFADDVRRLHTF